MVSIYCVCIKSTAFPGRVITYFCHTYGVYTIYPCCKYKSLNFILYWRTEFCYLDFTFRKCGKIILLLNGQFWNAQFIPCISIAVLRWCCELWSHFKHTNNDFFFFSLKILYPGSSGCYSEGSVVFLYKHQKSFGLK